MVCLWSLRSYTFMRNLTGGNRKTLYLLSSCDFSPDGALLATAAFSGSSWWIDLWDPYTAEKLATLVYVFSWCLNEWCWFLNSYKTAQLENAFQDFIFLRHSKKLELYVSFDDSAGDEVWFSLSVFTSNALSESYVPVSYDVCKPVFVSHSCF